jgi:pimeloyl-ACP methyl ester carboxylesterase
MLDVGSGPPLLLIPGIQGRWEWMRPTIEALATQWRVIACSLPGEPGSGADANGDFESLVAHVDRTLDVAGIRNAVICGVSFGGLIAVRYAARRPDRVRALILVSVPGPRWKPNAVIARYMKSPILSSPLFFFGSIRRFWPELRATYPGIRGRLRFCAGTLSRIVAAPAVPSRMSRRAKLAAAEHFDTDCTSVTAPTLVITGERGLDRVVKHDDTMEYVTLIDGARFQVFDRTGHLGCVSAPDRFVAIISRFIGSLAHPSELTRG